MFSMKQKQTIAAIVEKALLELDHPEMSKEKPSFVLHVYGKESWSFAVIKPNWTFDTNNPPSINPHNELVAEEMERNKK